MLNTLAFQLLQVSHNAQLVDGADGTGGNAQGYEVTGLRNEETLLLDVGYETTLRLTVGVGNVVAADRLFTRKFANFRHR